MHKNRINLLFVALAITLGFHGALIPFTFDRTYDIFPHLFFADHYASQWFDHWSYLWYTGMKVTSYPPGVHQLVALLSFVFGLSVSIILVQIMTMLLLVYGIYRFSKLWVSREAACWAALFSVFLGSICEAMHVFGQLPALLSLAITLHAMPFLYYWLSRANIKYLFSSIVLLAAATSVHHVTPLFGAVFFITPIGAISLSDKLFYFKQLNENQFQFGVRRNLREVWPIISRSIVFGVLLILVMIIVILPYWINSKTDPISQIPIPHLSRENFFLNLNAMIIFCLIPYGLLLPFMIYLKPRLLISRLWPMGVSIGALFIFGLGGTTPFAKMVFGPAFDILTFDRFTLWATILLMPPTGLFLVSLRSFSLKKFLVNNFGEVTWKLVCLFIAVSHIGLALFIVNLTKIKKMQPDRVKMTPISEFMDKDDHKKWRYLALGFGDQMAWLSVETKALTVDGNYHSARKLPELTSTPIERLDGSKFKGVLGLGSLQQFLTMPEKYNLKFIFSIDQFYDPILYFSGWNYVIQLENNVHVWEKPDVAPMTKPLPRSEISLALRLMWGIVPITCLIVGLLFIFNLAFARRRNIIKPTLPAVRLQRNKKIDRMVDEETNNYRDIAKQIISDLGVWQNERYRYLTTYTNLNYVFLRKQLSSLSINKYIRLSIVGSLVLGVVAPFYYLTASSDVEKTKELSEVYYNHLDQRRFRAAYSLLSTTSRPEYGVYREHLEKDSGLTSSYSKIHDIQTEVSFKDEKIIMSRSEITWLTALKYHRTSNELELLKEKSRWRIKYQNPDLGPSLPIKITDHPVVKWNLPNNDSHSRGSFKSLLKIMERPDLRVSQTKIVNRKNQLAVIGVAKNISNLPTYITVNAKLTIAGKQLENNAQSHMVHRLLPKEVTPFRIDFVPLALEENSEYYPDNFFYTDFAFTSESTSDLIDRFVVDVKGVVSTRKDTISTGVEVESISTEQNKVHLKIWNNSNISYGITKLVIGYFDVDNNLIWVDQKFIDKKISSGSFRRTFIRLPEENQVDFVRKNPKILVNGSKEDQNILPDTGLISVNHGSIRSIQVGLSVLRGRE